MTAIDAADIARLVARRSSPGQVFIVGVTGSVAVGKSTLCADVAKALRADRRVETVSTDGFLHSNAVLDARALTMRKGFPESYDADAMFAALAQVRAGPTRFPAYSHTIYDVDPTLAREIHAPDILFVEGLALSPLPDGRNPAHAVDALLYLDADEADLEAWFLERFMGLWRAAESDAASFYTRFRHMSEAEATAFARSVWAQINLPNLRDHIVHARDHAHIVVHKAAGHHMRLVRPTAA